MYIWVFMSLATYNCYGLVRRVSGFITVIVRAQSTVVFSTAGFKGGGQPCPKTRETAPRHPESLAYLAEIKSKPMVLQFTVSPTELPKRHYRQSIKTSSKTCAHSWHRTSTYGVRVSMNLNCVDCLSVNKVNAPDSVQIETCMQKTELLLRLSAFSAKHMPRRRDAKTLLCVQGGASKILQKRRFFGFTTCVCVFCMAFIVTMVLFARSQDSLL